MEVGWVFFKVVVGGMIGGLIISVVLMSVQLLFLYIQHLKIRKDLKRKYGIDQ